MSDFKPIQGFKNYETDGVSVKSVKTGNEMSVKSGSDKYQLFNDDGKRKLVTIDQLKELVIYTSPADAKSIIVNLECKKHIKIYKLHNIGCDNKEIAELLGTNRGHVHNALKSYQENPEKVSVADLIII